MPFMELFRGEGRHTWQLRFTDHLGIRRQLSTRTRDRSSALSISQKIERLVDLRIRGDRVPPDLLEWIGSRHQDIRGKLFDWQLADVTASNVGVRLSNPPPPNPAPPGWKEPPRDLIELWEDDMLVTEVTQAHAIQSSRRVRVLFEMPAPNEIPLTFPTDITADRVMARIRELRRIGPPHKHKRRKRRPLGPTTCQYYLDCGAEFCAWLVSRNILTENPLKGLVAYSAKVMRANQTRLRRAMLPAEQMLLITGTPSLQDRSGMTGKERALLYRLVLRSGLRAKEVRSMQVRNFNFFAKQMTVLASQGKARREDTLPIAEELLEPLREHFQNKHPHTPAFTPMDHKDYCAMLQDDLADLRIPVTDDLGRVLDFHALRHTYGTSLARVVLPAIHQKLMRHQDIRTTMEYYLHLEEEDKAVGLAKLPTLAPPAAAAKEGGAA